MGTAIPVILFFLLPVLLIYAIFSRWLIVDFLLSTFVAGIALSRFALPASRGKLDAGWFSRSIKNGESVRFALRYTLLTILWSAPIGVLMFLAARAAGGGFDLAHVGFSAVLLLIGALIIVVAPGLSMVIATATHEIHEVLSWTHWHELLVVKHQDTTAYFAAMIGGVVVFWAVYALPLALLIAVISAIEPRAGAAVGMLFISLPLAMTPILAGRLAGAYVAGTGPAEMTSRDAPSPGDPDLSNGGAPAITGDSDPLTAAVTEATVTIDPLAADNLLKKIAALPEFQQENALLLARNRLNARPEDPMVLSEIALLMCRSKQHDGLADAASSAIRATLRTGGNKIAARIFVDCGSVRPSLALKASELKTLARYLETLNSFQAAAVAWTMAMKTLAVDAEVVQEKLLELAADAEQAGRVKDSAGIMRYLEKLYPNDH